MTNKRFDCVQMKRNAQRELRVALQGKSPDAQAVEIARRAARNPIWQALVHQRNAAAPKRKATKG